MIFSRLVVPILSFLSLNGNVNSSPTAINPLIASEDDIGIPWLRGEGHTPAEGGFNNEARNTVVALWVLNDATWGAAGKGAETPVVIRATWTQQVVVSQVLAATKKGRMIDRLRYFLKTPRIFDVPEYKLNGDDLNCLYNNHTELDRFRTTASVTAMKRWIDNSYPESLWGSEAYTSRQQFYDQLKCVGEECRTHDMFHMLGLVNASYTINIDEDDETFCTSVSPQHIGEMVANQVNEYACIDGWNECDNDHGPYGPQAYRDTTGYYPVHSLNKKKFSHRWAPIVETDGRGYFTKQEFVVPHIGATADTTYLSAKDRKELNKQFTMEPYDNYEELARDVLDRTAMIADDEQYKTLIAWFDDKLNLAADTTAHFMFSELFWKLEDVSYYLQGYIMLEYDGIIANWHSKVENDHVRPTTVVQEYLSNEMTKNWMRGVNGTMSYPAVHWTPYIRVMPHGEFPSGSSCICTTVMKWSAQALRAGYDDDEDLTITYSHPSGSNKFEPSLPSSDFTKVYRSHKEVADTCAETRVYGGMHFPEATDAGDRMCGGKLVYEKGVAFQKFIWTGNEAFLEPWGGVESFGHVPKKDCKYNPNPKKRKGRKKEKNPSKFECK